MTTPREENVILNHGDSAPLFTLPAHPTGTVSLAEFLGRKNVVLAFYPKDNTPGCTKELCDFSDGLQKFESADTSVLGISCDTLESHQAFVKKYGISVPLLADKDGEVGRSYGAVRGDRYRSDRILFVIDKDGIIRYIRVVSRRLTHVRSELEQLMRGSVSEGQPGWFLLVLFYLL